MRETTETDKSSAVLMRCFTDKSRTSHLALPICNIDTSANIFGHIQQVFIDNEIAWSNLMIISFMPDNCSVMTGSNNSVVSRRKLVVRHRFCVHSANLCAVAGVKALILQVYLKNTSSWKCSCISITVQIGRKIQGISRLHIHGAL